MNALQHYNLGSNVYTKSLKLGVVLAWIMMLPESRYNPNCDATCRTGDWIELYKRVQQKVTSYQIFDKKGNIEEAYSIAKKDLFSLVN